MVLRRKGSSNSTLREELDEKIVKTFYSTLSQELANETRISSCSASILRWMNGEKYPA